MGISRLAAFIAALSLVVIAAGLRAATYDAVNDFDGLDNPSGTWSYLYANSVGASLAPLTLSSNLAGTGLPFFWTGMGVPNSVIVARNTTGSTLSYETIVQPTNELEMDPESLVDDVRWTAPAGGVYSVDGLFQAIDTGGGPHEVEILQNYNSASPLLNSPIAGYGAQVPFNFDLSVNAGNTLDFLVAYTGDYSNLSTGLAATITSVPEPGSLAAIAILTTAMLHRPRRP